MVSPSMFYILLTLICFKKSSIEALKVNVYPNPTSDVVSLNYSLNKPSEVEIKLLNQVGTEVMILQDKKILDGAQQTTFDLKSTLPSGVYFIALYIDGAIKTEKLIIK